MTPTMKALLRKEFARQRSLLIGGTVIMVVPYVLVATMNTIMDHNGAGYTWGETLDKMGTIGLIMSCIVAPMFGGGAIAGERPSRSIEFMSPLPLRLRTDLRSRLMAAVLMVLLLLTPNILLILVSEAFLLGNRKEFWEVCLILLLNILSLFGAFAVSFGASSWLKSPVLATAAGWASVLIVLLMGINTGREGWMTADTYWKFFYPVAVTALGVAGILFGCLHHTRRSSLA